MAKGGPAKRLGILLIAVAVAIGVAAAGAGGVFILDHRSSSGAGADSIVILPSASTRSGCITGDPGVPRPTYNLHEGILQANTYSVPTGTTGHVGMCYDAATGALFSYANWSKVGAAGGWFSYPQVTYGVNFWDGAFSTYSNQSAGWQLPQTVASVVDSDPWFVANYSITPPPSHDTDGWDLSLDDFFTERLPPVFEVGPFVEVEIFLAHNISYPPHWIDFSTPTLVNGTVVNAPWALAYWCHGTDNGTNANVSFDFSYGGSSSHGLLAGVLGVNLSAMLAMVEPLARSTTCWTGAADPFAGFYLDEANLGSEDGALGGVSFNYNWTIDDYCIVPFVHDADASTLACAPGRSVEEVRAIPNGASPTPPTAAAVVLATVRGRGRGARGEDGAARSGDKRTDRPPEAVVTNHK